MDGPVQPAAGDGGGIAAAVRGGDVREVWRWIVTRNERRKHDEDAANNYRAFAEQREQIRRDYAGQWVGFALGRVIAADPDDRKVVAAMEALDPQPEAEAVFRAEEEPVFEVIERYSEEYLPE